MNYKQAEYMLVIANEKNLTSAAKKLFVSQPALSHMLRQIEDEIGTSLFEREKSSLRPTPAGLKYLEAAQHLLIIHTNLTRELQMLKQDIYGSVTLGTPTQFALKVLPTVYPAFKKKYAHVQLKLKEQTSIALEDSVLDGSVDTALLMTSIKHKELNYLFVREVEFVVFASNETALAQKFLAETPISIAELSHENLISLLPNQWTRTMQDQLFEVSNVQPNIFFTTKSVQLAQLMVIACKGIMLCPRFYIKNTPEIQKQCSIYPILHYRSPINVYLCYRKDLYLTKYIQDLHELIVTCFNST